MSVNNYKQLITNFLNNTASEQELQEILELLKSKSFMDEFKALTKTNYLADYTLIDFDTDGEKEKLIKTIKTEINTKQKVIPLYKRSIFKYAALLLLFVSIGYLLLSRNSINNNKIPSTIVNNTVAPGTDKATLTLGNGTNITLEKGKNYNTSNLSSNGETLTYKHNSVATKEVVYNYLTIPRGGQFKLTLPDGTHVWLNSESQLKYPVSFVDNTPRNVELIYGEAYFDVSPSDKDNSNPFRVTSKHQNIEVLGTEFNVKAYNDDALVQTTLVEGKVKLNVNESAYTLQPNEQLTYTIDNKTASQRTVKVNNFISWKDGYFSFEDKSLKEVCKVMSRWYDIDIIISNPKIENIELTGSISRNRPIKDILESLYNIKNINYEITPTKEIHLN